MSDLLHILLLLWGFPIPFKWHCTTKRAFFSDSVQLGLAAFQPSYLEFLMRVYVHISSFPKWARASLSSYVCNSWVCILSIQLSQTRTNNYFTSLLSTKGRQNSRCRQQFIALQAVRKVFFELSGLGWCLVLRNWVRAGHGQSQAGEREPSEGPMHPNTRAAHGAPELWGCPVVGLLPAVPAHLGRERGNAQREEMPEWNAVPMLTTVLKMAVVPPTSLWCLACSSAG